MHSLILGKTLSGKSHLGKSLARKYQQAGISVLVLDPMNDPDWPCDFKTIDREEFMRVALANRRAALFLDEGKDSVGLGAEMEWITTQSRHWGYRAFLLSQRARQMSLTIRDNCSNMFIFRLGPSDADTLSKDLDSPPVIVSAKGGIRPYVEGETLQRGDKIKPMLSIVHKLPQYHYIAGGDFRPFRLQKLAA